MQNPITTPVKLAACNRCGRYVFAATTGGLKVTADPAPVPDAAAYREKLLAGQRLFDLEEQAGRPHKLHTRTQWSPAPTWTPQSVTGAVSSRTRHILAEHGCGAHGMDATRAEVTPVGPPPAPATHGSTRAGHHPPTAHASGAQTSPAATHANTHLSDRPPRCTKCGRYIKKGVGFSGIHHMRWQWAQHERCPDV